MASSPLQCAQNHLIKRKLPALASLYLLEHKIAVSDTMAARAESSVRSSNPSAEHCEEVVAVVRTPPDPAIGRVRTTENCGRNSSNWRTDPSVSPVMGEKNRLSARRRNLGRIIWHSLGRIRTRLEIQCKVYVCTRKIVADLKRDGRPEPRYVMDCSVVVLCKRSLARHARLPPYTGCFCVCRATIQRRWVPEGTRRQTCCSLCAATLLRW